MLLLRVQSSQLRILTQIFPVLDTTRHDTGRLRGCLVTSPPPTCLMRACPGPAPLTTPPRPWGTNRLDNSGSELASPMPKVLTQSSMKVRHADACGVSSWLCRAVRGCTDTRARMQTPRDTTHAQARHSATATPDWQRPARISAAGQYYRAEVDLAQAPPLRPRELEACYPSPATTPADHAADESRDNYFVKRSKTPRQAPAANTPEDRRVSVTGAAKEANPPRGLNGASVMYDDETSDVSEAIATILVNVLVDIVSSGSYRLLVPGHDSPMNVPRPPRASEQRFRHDHPHTQHNLSYRSR